MAVYRTPQELDAAIEVLESRCAYLESTLMVQLDSLLDAWEPQALLIREWSKLKSNKRVWRFLVPQLVAVLSGSVTWPKVSFISPWLGQTIRMAIAASLRSGAMTKWIAAFLKFYLPKMNRKAKPESNEFKRSGDKVSAW